MKSFFQLALLYWLILISPITKAGDVILLDHETIDFWDIHNMPYSVHAGKSAMSDEYIYTLRPMGDSANLANPMAQGPARYWVFKYDHSGKCIAKLPLNLIWEMNAFNNYFSFIEILPDNSLFVAVTPFNRQMQIMKIPADLSAITKTDSIYPYMTGNSETPKIYIDSIDITILHQLQDGKFCMTTYDFSLNIISNIVTNYGGYGVSMWGTKAPHLCFNRINDGLLISYVANGISPGPEKGKIINDYWNNQGRYRFDIIESQLLDSIFDGNKSTNLINTFLNGDHIYYHILIKDSIVQVYSWDTVLRILTPVNAYYIQGAYGLSGYGNTMLGMNTSSYHTNFKNGDFVTEYTRTRSFNNESFLYLHRLSGLNAFLDYSSTFLFPDSCFMMYNNHLLKIITYNARDIIKHHNDYYIFGSLRGYSDGIYNPYYPDFHSYTYMYFLKKLTNSGGLISGYTYKDLNKNCLFGSMDQPYKNILIEFFNPANHNKYYSISQDSGKYYGFLNLGTYNIKPIPPSDLWGACVIDPVAIDSSISNYTINLGLKKLVDCPNLTVSITTDRLRACQNATYFVNYCNRGTADAVNPVVKVTMDSALSVTSASVPYTQSGDIYTFQLNNVKEDSCGQFIIHVLPACDLVPGSTHCVKAHIFPDSICVPADPRWDRSNVSVDGACLGDSVLFRIRNIGTGNMSSVKKYIVIEDNVLRVRPTDFQLLAGQELLIKREANGSTQRLIAEQADYFPYPSNPTAVVEGCGGWNTGFVNAFANDDAADFVAISCMEAMNSFDPNDKLAAPVGVSNEHYLSLGTPINYTIRFQNTGNDTAYDIVIYDTLSNKLDVASLQMGSSSHPYSYEISGAGRAVLKVIFRNINLVDSFHNEPLSHGFFSYSVKQDTLNEEGDVIYNDAYIYFDANHPIKTNTTWHTVGDPYYSVISAVVQSKNPIQTTAYPNPFRDKCIIEIKSLSNKNQSKYHFMLYDITGRIIEEETAYDRIEIDASDLTSSMYLYRIELNGELVGAGKIVKE